jgi:cell division protein FtsB
MKTTPFIYCFLFGTSMLLNAQKPITIKESDILFKHGSIPGLIVSIPEVQLKTVEESWIKMLEKGTKSTVQKDFEEMTIFGALIKDVAGGPINVYSYIKQSTDSITTLAVSFELKKDEYITSDKREFEFNKAKQYLFQFAKDHYTDLVKDQMQVEEKKQNKLENKLNSLQNENGRLERTIQSDTADISSLNKELAILRSNLESLNAEQTSQTAQLNAMSNGAGKDEKRKYIADLEKRINKTNTSISADEKKLSNTIAELDNARTVSLPTNIKEQAQVNAELEKQREITIFFTNKYNTIKAFTL